MSSNSKALFKIPMMNKFKLKTDPFIFILKHLTIPQYFKALFRKNKKKIK